MINHESHGRQSPASVNRPEVGLALLPLHQLPRQRARYVELLRTLGASPATAYARGVIHQIDARLGRTSA
jgi:hypothetical protein